MVQSPTNQIIVKVKTKYIKNISTLLKIAEIQNLSSVTAADCVNVVGEVVSIPKIITGEYEGFSTNDIKVGDVAIFSHDVIYSFLGTEPEADPIYKNLFIYQEYEYFTCNIRNLYAVVRGENVRMQNGYVMLEGMNKPSGIYLPQHLKKTVECAFGVVTKTGHPLTTEKDILLQAGDTVYFSPNRVRVYQVNEKPFGIIKQSQILGRKVPTYEELAALN